MSSSLRVEIRFSSSQRIYARRYGGSVFEKLLVKVKHREIVRETNFREIVQQTSFKEFANKYPFFAVVTY
jgi:hypothetical protein